MFLGFLGFQKKTAKKEGVWRERIQGKVKKRGGKRFKRVVKWGMDRGELRGSEKLTDPWNVLNVHHQIIVFCDGPGDLHNWGFLKCIRSYYCSGYLPSDGHHGNTVHQGICQPSHKVRCTWSRCGNTYTHSPCGFRISLSRKYLTLLMATQDVPD